LLSSHDQAAVRGAGPRMRRRRIICSGPPWARWCDARARLAGRSPAL